MNESTGGHGVLPYPLGGLCWMRALGTSVGTRYQLTPNELLHTLCSIMGCPTKCPGFHGHLFGIQAHGSKQKPLFSLQHRKERGRRGLVSSGKVQGPTKDMARAPQLLEI